MCVCRLSAIYAAHSTLSAFICRLTRLLSYIFLVFISLFFQRNFIAQLKGCREGVLVCGMTSVVVFGVGIAANADNNVGWWWKPLMWELHQWCWWWWWHWRWWLSLGWWWCWWPECWRIWWWWWWGSVAWLRYRQRKAWFALVERWVGGRSMNPDARVRLQVDVIVVLEMWVWLIGVFTYIIK